ncbi:sensor histidine kinase, partial [Zhouia sp. PK063]|uniref:sensor histidine kinase n=1 Tax=Zhouia sp. PK063 TaxID=3373602 RepID=UPI0037B204EA
RLEQKQKEANAEILHLMVAENSKVEQGKEEERKRIARELHDGILGKLFGVRLSLDFLNNRKEEEVIEKRKGYLEELKNIGNEIRLLSHQLNYDSQFKKEFAELIKNYVFDESLPFDIQLNMDDNINWEMVEDTVKLNLFRILQEALNNIIKHANATTVVINFTKKAEHLSLEIQDNGTGFDTAKASDGIGLQNMKKRVQQLKGTCKINTGENGTTVAVE